MNYTPSNASITHERPRLRPMFRLQWEEVQQSWVMLFPEGMIRLNPSAAEIMRRCDGDRTVDQIVGELEQTFNMTALAPEVQAFLAHAREKGWLT